MEDHIQQVLDELWLCWLRLRRADAGDEFGFGWVFEDWMDIQDRLKDVQIAAFFVDGNGEPCNMKRPEYLLRLFEPEFYVQAEYGYLRVMPDGGIARLTHVQAITLISQWQAVAVPQSEDEAYCNFMPITPYLQIERTPSAKY